MGESEQLLWLTQLRKLERYCNAKGFRVVYKQTPVGSVHTENKLIVMDNSLRDEIALYHLLHEMGHVRLMQKTKSYEKTYGYILDGFSKTSLTYRVTILQEELDAWKEGLILAELLNLHIDRRNWEIAKARCIATYVSWIETQRLKKKEANKVTKKEAE